MPKQVCVQWRQAAFHKPADLSHCSANTETCFTTSSDSIVFVNTLRIGWVADLHLHFR